MDHPCRPLVLALAISALSACAHKNPLYCDNAGSPCTDPAKPFCDVEGEHEASEGIGHTCIPDPFTAAPDAGPPGGRLCDPDAFVQCADDATALYCNADGSAYVTTACDVECDADRGGCFCEPNTSTCSADVTLACDEGGVAHRRSCALGCNDTAERCVDVDPSNGLAGYLDQSVGGPDLVLTAGATIDTDTGIIENGDGSVVEVPSFQVAAPENGVPIRVFAVKSLVISDVSIDGARALAFVSDGDVAVGGTVRVLAGPMVASLGRGRNGLCDVEEDCGESCDAACGGPGGGGHGTAGGAGGNATSGPFAILGSVGGSAQGSSALVPLRGGSSGGSLSAGGGPTDDPANGGGAIQIVSRTRIELGATTAATVNAGGEGGNSVEGGGAGGGILLEAPRIVLASGSKLVANGGGGGCMSGSGNDGNALTPAAGGSSAHEENGTGGTGATSTQVAGNGESVSLAVSTLVFGGAGGGGMGRVRVNVPTHEDFKQHGSTSPTASVGSLATR